MKKDRVYASARQILFLDLMIAAVGRAIREPRDYIRKQKSHYKSE